MVAIELGTHFGYKERPKPKSPSEVLAEDVLRCQSNPVSLDTFNPILGGSENDINFYLLNHWRNVIENTAEGSKLLKDYKQIRERDAYAVTRARGLDIDHYSWDDQDIQVNDDKSITYGVVHRDWSTKGLVFVLHHTIAPLGDRSLQISQRIRTVRDDKLLARPVRYQMDATLRYPITLLEQPRG